MSLAPKVSVILPVYNAGKYFRKCLDTIVNQTLTDLEIILVLDCPTDGSDKVAEEYANRDNRIKIIRNEENLHIGLSRNKGLEMATGEYVAFSDHDDYRELNMYEELYNEAKRNGADIIMSQVATETDGKRTFWNVPCIPSKEFRHYVLSDLIGQGNYGRSVSLFCNVHNILYRRKLIFDNEIHFVDTRNATPEDVIFQIQAVYFAEKIHWVNKPYYYHVLYSTSEGHTYDYVSNEKRGNGMNEIYRFLNMQGCYACYEINFLLQVRKQFLNSLLGVLYWEKSIDKFISACKMLKSYPFTRKAFCFYSDNDYMSKKHFLKKKMRRFVVKRLLE